MTIILGKTNEARRAELYLLLAPTLEREAELNEKLKTILDRAKPVFDEKDGERVARMDERGVQVTELAVEDRLLAESAIQERDAFRTIHQHPLMVRWGVTDVKDWVHEERAGTIEDILGPDAPDGLLTEIVDQLTGRIDLSVEKKTASLSPTTSSEQAMPPTTSTTAKTAESTSTS